MKTLYFDCFSGISGDMTIGALLDLGIDSGLFIEELSKLHLEGYELRICSKIKNGIKGTDFSVDLVEVPHSHGDGHSHSHEHEHTHKHEHNHDHSHGDSHSHSMRNLTDIEAIINHSGLSGYVKAFSKAVFLEIAKAEAKVHDMDINEVHFHEVGAVDSIVDIVGTAVCLELLGVEKVYSSVLHDGNGTIECRHGLIPVPVPAVMEMLSGSGIPLVSEDVATELVTPTGMALIKHMSEGFGKMPPITVQKTGYGMGKRETGRFNALRVIMGELYEEMADEEIVILETNIDDMSPEILGYTSSRLFENGALDVFYTPIYMKKGRPATMLTVLADSAKEQQLSDMILQETTTLGIRRTTCKRYCMEREIVRLETEFGDMRVKVASKGDIKKASPEYEDCREIAQSKGIPIARVYEAAMESARRHLTGKK